MRRILTLIAAAEAGTGALVLASPDAATRVLLGNPVTGAGAVMSRIAAVALIGLGVAGWPSASNGSRAGIRGLLVYGVLVTITLAVVGLGRPRRPASLARGGAPRGSHARSGRGAREGRRTLSPILVSALVVVCVYGGALVGMALRPRLPQDHLSSDSRDMMKVGIGLVGTTSALVLGLLVASAKEAYDAQKAEVTSLAARVAMLDRAFAHYGPEARPLRELLKQNLQKAIQQIWHEDLSIGPADTRGEVLYDRLQDLAPQTDTQRAIKAAATEVAVSIGQIRWTMFARRGSAVFRRRSSSWWSSG